VLVQRCRCRGAGAEFRGGAEEVVVERWCRGGAKAVQMCKC